MEGSWDVYTGQYFSRFNREQHVISAAEALARCKPWHTYWLSGDWGYEHPHAIYLHARDDMGRITTIAELWDRHVCEQELAQRIGHMCSVVKMNEIKGFTFVSVRLTPSRRRDQGKRFSSVGTVHRVHLEL